MRNHLKKVRSEVGFRLEYDGQVWVVDMAEYRDLQGNGELRVTRIEGNVTTPLLKEALELEAASRAVTLNH